MAPEFNLESIANVEFGVGIDDASPPFRLITVDGKVQDALAEMVRATWAEMATDQTPAMYEPSEKYGTKEYVRLALSADLAKRLRDLHQAENLPTDSSALTDPGSLFAYFARMTDKQGRRLTGLRRAIQFKGVLNSRLVRVVSDALRLVEDRVFRLDTDFDLLVDSKFVHILHPSAFEFAGQLQTAILEAVPVNIEAIQVDLPFVEFAELKKYASTHPRAARYLASIRSQKETKNINQAALRKLCRATGVELLTVNGRIKIPQGQELGFLEVLDRRRYQLELVKDSPERFRASSRSKIE